MEKLTHDLVGKAWAHIEEVEKLGGMAKAIETGLPKLRIAILRQLHEAADLGVGEVVGVEPILHAGDPCGICRVQGHQTRLLM